MQRHIAAWLLSTLVTIPSAWAGDDLAAIQKSGRLRVIVDESNLPELFNLAPIGPPGLEQEILAGFAALHRLKIEVVTVHRADERLAGLLKGTGDLVAGIVETDSRRRIADFSTEILPTRHVVLTRKPDVAVSTLEELRSRRVATMKGTSWAEEVLAAGVPRASVDDSHDTARSMMQALASGRASAVVMTVMWAVVEKKKDADLQIGLFIGPSTRLAFAVRKDSPALKTALDDYIANLRRTATWSRLVVKYFGESGLEILRRSRPE